MIDYIFLKYLIFLKKKKRRIFFFKFLFSLYFRTFLTVLNVLMFLKFLTIVQFNVFDCFKLFETLDIFDRFLTFWTVGIYFLHFELFYNFWHSCLSWLGQQKKTFKTNFMAMERHKTTRLNLPQNRLSEKVCLLASVIQQKQLDDNNDKNNHFGPTERYLVDN